MIHNTVQLSLTATRGLDLTHKQLCRLLVSIVNWKRAHIFDEHVSYKGEFTQAEKAVKEARHKVFNFTENRRNKIMSTHPPASLRPDEVKFFERAFELYFKLGVPEEAWDAIVRSMSQAVASRNKQDVRRVKQEDPFKHLALLSGVLGLKRVPSSQERLRFVAGEYLLFRRVRGKRLLAAHFTINAPNSDDEPATFLTLGSPGGAVQDAREVEGVIYEPLEAPGFLFAIGKIKNSSEIRMSILAAVDKPTRLDNPPRGLYRSKGYPAGSGAKKSSTPSLSNLVLPPRRRPTTAAFANLCERVHLGTGTEFFFR
jgi:hypothetical protein